MHHIYMIIIYAADVAVYVHMHLQTETHSHYVYRFYHMRPERMGIGVKLMNFARSFGAGIWLKQRLQSSSSSD